MNTYFVISFSFRILLIAALLGIGPVAAAHEVLHTITKGEATIVTLSFADGAPLSDKGYEIYYGDETTAHQTGRSDARGRIAFVADRAGAWRLRAFTEDGHGTDLVFDASPSTGGVVAQNPSPFRFERIVTGIAVLFGIFGILTLLRRRSS